MVDLSFSFNGECWLWQGKGAWHFITLPKEKSEEIKYFSENLSQKKRGWCAVKVSATVGKTTWETSIFPSKELGAYILPVKKAVRDAENIQLNNTVAIALKIEL